MFKDLPVNEQPLFGARCNARVIEVKRIGDSEYSVSEVKDRVLILWIP